LLFPDAKPSPEAVLPLQQARVALRRLVWNAEEIEGLSKCHQGVENGIDVKQRLEQISRSTRAMSEEISSKLEILEKLIDQQADVINYLNLTANRSGRLLL